MIYGNLIYLLIVIAILTIGRPPEGPLFPSYQVVSFFILKAWLFRQTIRFYLQLKKIRRISEYFAVERIFSVVALILFGLDVYLFDLQYYLDLLPFSQKFPFLTNLVGIGVFLFYLVLLWLQLRRSYEVVVGVSKNSLVHIGEKLRICIALILPWLIASLLQDLLLLVPNVKIQDFIASPWGESLLLLVMIVAAVIWFPVMLVRLFGCTPVLDGHSRRHIEQFCRHQGVRFRGIYLWPLVEGKVLTAGVVGLIGRSRYLLITPALLTALSEEELDSVVAHEIGHVKKHHMLLYLLLFLGLWVLLQLCLQPLIYLLLSTRLFYEFLFVYEGDPGTFLTILVGVPLVILLLTHFRYVFGFFMRNFERQADQYSFKVLGSATPLISVFKKIALLSGSGRDIPCWHHFSIGQRIDYLLSCQRDGYRAKRHNYKVYTCLAGYFVAISVALVVALQFGDRLIASQSGQELAEEVIFEKIERDPGNALWHQFHGDLLVGRKQYADAINAFELSLQLYPDNPEVLNNLAWLLLTVEERHMLDSGRALELAQKAANIQARSHILDTLAEAYWQNGMAGMAIETAQRALKQSSGNKEYYRKQLKKFSLSTRS